MPVKRADLLGEQLGEAQKALRNSTPSVANFIILGVGTAYP